MKQLFTLLFGMLLSLNVTACSKNESGIDNLPYSETENQDNNSEADKPEENDGKILIVYFSRTGYNYPNQWLDVGHTARVAGYIAELTGGDRFEIIPVAPYPDNYQETVAIAREEYDNNVRPAIKNEIENISNYDIIFIGGPVWHGAMPMIVRTFYESYDLTGKTIVPFTTHAGSGLGDAAQLARDYYPDNTVLDGLAVQGTNSQNARSDVEAWLRRIGIIE